MSGKPARGPATAGSAARQYLRTITVYLPRGVHRQLGEHAAASGTTRTALLLAAVNVTHGHLGELLRASGGGEPVGAEELFDIPQQRNQAEPTVQTSIRVTDRQLDALDGLARTHGVHRSQILTAAMRGYLETTAG